MYTLLIVTPKLMVGGAQLQLLALLRGLDKDRFRPIVAPLYPGGELAQEFRAVPGIEVIDLNRRGKWDFLPLARVAMLLRARRIDIVMPFVSPAAFFGLLPGLLAGTPALIATERSGSRHLSGTGPKAYDTIEGWLARAADVVIANSEAGRQLMLRRGVREERIRVIRNGLDPRRLRPDPARVASCRLRLSPTEGAGAVGVVATLTPAKRHDVFLEAAAMVSTRLPQTRFAIVGDGPLRESLESRARSLGLADRVVFFGHQPRVADCLAALDVLVSSSCDLEGHSNSILEAMSLGVPVVATDVGGNPELVQEGVTGSLVTVGDPAAIAGRVVEILTEREIASARAVRARAMVQSQFGFERMVAEYEALYTALLTTDRPRRRTRWSQAGGVMCR
jgi:glycosyltransferase involved in cell wall biosynthesis